MAVAGPEAGGAGARKGEDVEAERLAGEAGLAVAEVIVPCADEGVVEAERAHDGVERGVEVGAPPAQRLAVVQAEVVGGLEDEAGARGGGGVEQRGDAGAAAAGEDDGVDKVGGAQVGGSGSVMACRTSTPLGASKRSSAPMKVAK